MKNLNIILASGVFLAIGYYIFKKNKSISKDNKKQTKKSDVTTENVNENKDKGGISGIANQIGQLFDSSDLASASASASTSNTREYQFNKNNWYSADRCDYDIFTKTRTQKFCEFGVCSKYFIGKVNACQSGSGYLSNQGGFYTIQSKINIQSQQINQTQSIPRQQIISTPQYTQQQYQIPNYESPKYQNESPKYPKYNYQLQDVAEDINIDLVQENYDKIAIDSNRFFTIRQGFNGTK